MDFDTRVKLSIYSHFSATGHAPSPEGVAKSIDSDVEGVLESDGRSIRMAPPFSGVPTRHIVEADGIQYFSNCAWDAGRGGEPQFCVLWPPASLFSFLYDYSTSSQKRSSHLNKGL